MRLVTSLALSLIASSASAFDISTCYQLVHMGEVGVLQADLVCDGSGGPNVNLRPGGVLQLNGHTIQGGNIGIATEPGNPWAIVEGPGEVFGASGAGPVIGCGISAESKLWIRGGVSVHDNRCGIVSVYGSSLTLVDTTVRDNTEDGVTYAFVTGQKDKVKAKTIDVHGNGGVGLTAYGLVLLKTSTFTGNAGGGVRATRRVTAKYSTLTGNGGSDIASFVRPSVSTSTCNHSLNLTDNSTFGVCALD